MCVLIQTNHISNTSLTTYGRETQTLIYPGKVSTVLNIN